MKLDDILVMWEEDSTIDDKHLGEMSTSSPKLHAKYLRLLIDAKIKRSKIETDLKELRRTKFRYYRGELSRDELTELGWEQWQYNKPLKAEMDEFLDGDKDLNVLNLRFEHMATVCFALESILGQIKQRDWQIKNGIQWKEFLAGK